MVYNNQHKEQKGNLTKEVNNTKLINSDLFDIKEKDRENISNNINSEFNIIVGDPNAYIEKKDVEVVAMYPKGNCFYRSISYFLFNNQKYYKEIKN